MSDRIAKWISGGGGTGGGGAIEARAYCIILNRFLLRDRRNPRCVDGSSPVPPPVKEVIVDWYAHPDNGGRTPANRRWAVGPIDRSLADDIMARYSLAQRTLTVNIDGTDRTGVLDLTAQTVDWDVVEARLVELPLREDGD